MNILVFPCPIYSHQVYVWIFTRQHATLFSLDTEHLQMTLTVFSFFNSLKKQGINLISCTTFGCSAVHAIFLGYL